MKTIDKCRVCNNKDLKEIVNLGEQYLSDFRDDDQKPPKYPIVVMFCPECLLVQLKHETPPEEMYHDRYGFKSGVNNTIKADLQSIVDEALTYKPSTWQKKGNDRKVLSWLDIACNDGTLLSYVPDGFVKVGVDPVSKFKEESSQHANLIIDDFYRYDLVQDFSKFDVITSISCFYDMPDPNKFVSDVKQALDRKGVWIVQQNYLYTTLQYNAVDNMCHEHLEYYSMLSLNNLLERHDLEIIDVSTSTINGGSFRTVIAHKGQYKVEASVRRQIMREYADKMDTVEPYREFNRNINVQMKALKALITSINNRGQKVFIYGASTRGGTIWQAAGLDVNDLPYAVERNPEKFGKKIASIGVPIISEGKAREIHPEYMLVSPWFFRDEFVEREAEYLKKNGKLIFPLPKLEIVSN